VRWAGFRDRGGFLASSHTPMRSAPIDSLRVDGRPDSGADLSMLAAVQADGLAVRQRAAPASAGTSNRSELAPLGFGSHRQHRHPRGGAVEALPLFVGFCSAGTKRVPPWTNGPISILSVLGWTFRLFQYVTGGEDNDAQAVPLPIGRWLVSGTRGYSRGPVADMTGGWAVVCFMGGCATVEKPCRSRGGATEGPGRRPANSNRPGC
jgi:hypothetical protein